MEDESLSHLINQLNYKISKKEKYTLKLNREGIYSDFFMSFDDAQMLIQYNDDISELYRDIRRKRVELKTCNNKSVFNRIKWQMYYYFFSNYM